MAAAEPVHEPMLGRKRIARLSVLVSVVFGVVSLAACTVEADEPPHIRPPPSEPAAPPPATLPSTGQAPRTASIVTGELLQSEPGEGAGLFVAYVGDGLWRLHTTCDTTLTGLSCAYAYTLRAPQGNLREPVLDRTDGSMQLVRYAEGYDVGYQATNGIDALAVQVDPPGSPLEVAVWLDGEPDARLLYWVSPAGVEHGAATNPIVLQPTER